MGYQRQRYEKQHNKFMCKHSGSCYGFHGGYWYDTHDQRYKKINANHLQKYVKDLHNKQFRRQFKAKLVQNLDDEQLIKTKEKMYDLWGWW